jgi:hypothetical protein
MNLLQDEANELKVCNKNLEDSLGSVALKVCKAMCQKKITRGLTI